jgi:transcriptional regulator with XRE-family HTH domain
MSLEERITSSEERPTTSEGNPTSSGTFQQSWGVGFILGTALLSSFVGVPATTAADYPLILPGNVTSATFTGQLQPSPAEMEQGRTVAKAVLELRRLSGLTWQELADMLNVHRRTVHLWANGRPINAANEHRVQRLLGAMRQLDRGEATRNRNLLLEPQVGGATVFGLLRDESWDKAVAIVGAGQGRPSRPVPAAADFRRPAPPAELIGTIPDRIHEFDGGLVRSKSATLKSRRKV